MKLLPFKKITESNRVDIIWINPGGISVIEPWSGESMSIRMDTGIQYRVSNREPEATIKFLKECEHG